MSDQLSATIEAQERNLGEILQYRQIEQVTWTRSVEDCRRGCAKRVGKGEIPETETTLCQV